MSDTQGHDHGQRTATLSGRVQNQLNLLSASMRRTQTLCCVLSVLLATALAILLTGLIDFVWPLTATTRAVSLLAIVACGIVVLIKRQIAINKVSPYDAAVDVESAHPELGQRLRTAWQFRAKNMTSSASPQLVDALIEDTNVRAERMSFAGIVTRSKLIPATACLVAAVMITLALLMWVPETRITFARLALFPIHYTQVQFEPPREPLTAGSEITLQAEVQGRSVPKAELLVRKIDSDDSWTAVPMTSGDQPQQEKAEVHGRVSAKLDDCQHDLEYKVVAGPVMTLTYQLRILQPLEQESFTATVDPPKYTGLEQKQVEDLAFTVAEGSQVQLQLTLNRIADKARLVPVSGGNRSQNKGDAIGMQIEGRNLVCDLGLLLESQQYEIVAEASDGMSFESDRVRIRVNKDHRPVVTFNRPNEQIEATPTTEVALAVNISDDYGLGRVGIEYQIGNGQKRLLWEQDLAGETSSVKTIPVLYLEKHELSFDDAITYYAFAEDSRKEPRRSSSELRFIDIRPYKREFQIVDSACKGGGGSCLTLEELIARQRQNLRRTFANVDAPAVRDDLAQRLARTQLEIREATTEFTSGWESKFGPVPSLHDATASMELAETELNEQQLPTGLLHEQAALEGLISARKNIRKFIKNCSGGGLSQCQQYDNQMLQKLRAPEQDARQPDKDEPPQSVQPRLDELAKEQREWSEQLKMRSSGGVQLDKKNPPAPNSSSPAQQPKPKTMSQLAQSQQACSSSAQQMQQALRGDAKASELSQQRMDEIAERIQQSLEALKDGNTSEAAQEAERAAELAEQLNEHLRGLAAADFSERLGVAEQIARRVAAGEQEVSKQLQDPASIDPPQQERVADVQHKLAEQVATLSDLLKYLEADASLDHPQMQRDLRDLQEMHAPVALSEDMRASAGKIRKRQFDQARKGTEDAGRELSALARGLAGIRREFLQPRLNDLMAAEAQAAGMLANLKDMDDPATQAKLTTQMGELQAMLRALNISVSSSTASSGAASAPRPSASASTGEAMPPSIAPHLGRPTLGQDAQLRQIMQVLQQKIQDAILLAARMDADEPVPPVYRRLVEEYYQTLSDDLR